MYIKYVPKYKQLVYGVYNVGNHQSVYHTTFSVADRWVDTCQVMYAHGIVETGK